MPEWISPAAVNTFFLAVFFCVVIWAGIKISAFFAPLLRNRLEKATAKHEADAELSKCLQTTSVTQTELMRNQATMLADHGIKLGHHGEVLDDHSVALHAIARKVGADVRIPPRTGTVRMTSALEVSPGNDATVRPVVVVEDVQSQ